MKKQTKQEKYMSGLKAKGLKKALLVFPIKDEEEIRKLAKKRREDHLGEK